MDWNRAVLLLSQVVVIIVLGTLVALGHDSAITDGLLITAGSVTGINAYSTIKRTVDKKESSADTPHGCSTCAIRDTCTRSPTWPSCGFWISPDLTKPSS
jgi:hypothetical protein